MNSWKNNNLLNKFKESLPIEERDSYADWKSEYDYKNSEEGHKEDLKKRLNAYKLSKAIEDCVDIWNYAIDKIPYFGKLGYGTRAQYIDITDDTQHIYDSQSFDSVIKGTTHRSNFMFFVSPVDHYGDIKKSFIDSKGVNCGLVFQVSTDILRTLDVKGGPRLVKGLKSQIINRFYKNSSIDPIIKEGDDYFMYYWNPITDNVERGEEVIDLLASLNNR